MSQLQSKIFTATLVLCMLWGLEVSARPNVKGGLISLQTSDGGRWAHLKSLNGYDQSENSYRSQNTIGTGDDKLILVYYNQNAQETVDKLFQDDHDQNTQKINYNLIQKNENTQASIDKLIHENRKYNIETLKPQSSDYKYPQQNVKQQQEGSSLPGSYTLDQLLNEVNVNHTEHNKRFARGLFSSVTGFVSDVVDDAAAAAASAAEDVSDFGSDVGNHIAAAAEDVSDFGSDVGNHIAAGAEDVLEFGSDVGDEIAAAAGDVSDFGSDFGDQFLDAAGNVFDFGSDIGGHIAAGAGDIFDFGSDAGAGDFLEMGSDLGEIGDILLEMAVLM